LDWRVIQDQIGAQAAPMVYWPTPTTPLSHSFQYEVPMKDGLPEGKVLFEENFEGLAGEYAEHPGVTLVEDPDGDGKCVRISTSEYRLANRISVTPGHWIVVSWKARTITQGAAARIEADFMDSAGKPIELTFDRRFEDRERLWLKASSGKTDAGWTRRFWSHAPDWSAVLYGLPPELKSVERRAATRIPPEATSIGLRFYHDDADSAVTLIDEIRVVDLQPVALGIVRGAIEDHRKMLSDALKRIRAVPERPNSSGWKKVVATKGNMIESRFRHFAEQDPTSERFILGSDQMLILARRFADAAAALEAGVAQPTPILTYQTRAVPSLGPIYNQMRSEPVGVTPYALDIEGTLGDEASIRACPGEFEPVSIVLWSPNGMNQVTLRASDLKGAAGVIPAANLDIKVVACWYQRSSRPWSKSVLGPRFLLNDESLIEPDHRKRVNLIKVTFPDGQRYVEPPSYDENGAFEEEFETFPIRDSDTLQPFTLIGGQNKQLWITVKIPDDAGAGKYAGDLAFQSGGRDVATMKLNVEVLPFSLPDPKTQYDSDLDYTIGMYHRGRLTPDGKGKVGYRSKTEEQLRAELKMLLDHGVVAPLLLPPGWGVPESRLRRELEIMRELGFSGRPLYFGRGMGAANEEEKLKEVRQYVRDRIALAKEYGFTEVYFYGRDEGDGELMRAQRPTWRAIREAGGKVHVAVTWEWVDEAPEELDSVNAFGWPQKKWADHRHRLGGKIKSYATPHTSNRDPLPYRRNCGLYGWSFDYDGVMIYCFMHNYNGVWNDLDGPDFNIAFPTVNGAVNTLTFEALREGSDDVRYATLLMRRIEQAKTSGSPGAKATADEASQWLEAQDFIVADLDEARARMIDFIVALGGD
jgi:hypothetical protein